MEEELQRASVMPRDFTFTFLEHITNKFSKDRIIGHGGYGVVYKGVLDNGEQIAIKKLYPKHPELDDDKQFKNECINLMRVQHQNVVRLVGYCHEISHKVWPYEGKYVFAEVEERALCFEFLQGGSLDKHLSDESSKLGWRTCYKIIKGISEGLLYLHHGSKDPIYHLDLKPVTNSQSKQEFNQYASSGAADAESASTALRNPRVKYGDEGTSMGMKEKERSFPVLDPRIPTMPSPSRPSSSSDSNIEAGSGSGSAGDECKRKRMLWNREAARRSRARKQQRMEELIAEASRLQAENARVEAQIGAYSAELGKVDGENAVLRSHHSGLAGRLQALGGVLEIFQVAGAPVDIPEIPDPMLRPWQSPFAP